MMLKRLLSVFFSLSFILVAVIVGTVIWFSYYIDSQEFRDQFTRALSQVADAPVELDGELDISFWPALGLSAHNLKIHDALQPGAEPLFEVEKLTVSLEFAPLLKGQYELDRVFLSGGILRLRRAMDGTANWTRFMDMGRHGPDSNATSSDSFDPQSALVKGLEIKDAEVYYTDAKQGQSLHFRGIGLSTGPIRSGNPVAMTLSGVFSDRKNWMQVAVDVQGTLNLGAEQADSSSGAVVHAVFQGDLLPKGAKPGEGVARLLYDPRKKQLRLDDIQVGILGLRASGAVATDPLDGPLGATGSISFHPLLIADILKQFDLALPADSGVGKEGKASLETKLRIDTSMVQLTDLRAVVDGKVISGAVNLPLGHGKTSIRLGTQSLDADQYSGLWEQKAGAKPLKINPLDILQDLHLDANLTIGKFRLLGQDFEDVKGVLSAEKGVMALDVGPSRWQGAVFNGHGNATLSGEGGARVADVSVAAEMKGVRADLLPLFSNFVLLVEGNADLRVQGGWNHLALEPLPTLDAIFEGAAVEAWVNLAPGSVTIDTTKGGWNRAFPHTGAQGHLRLEPMHGPEGWMTKRAHGEISAQLLDPDAVLHATSDGPLQVAKEFYNFASQGMTSSASLRGKLFSEPKDIATVIALMGWDCRGETFSLDQIEATGLGGMATGYAHATSLSEDNWRFTGQARGEHQSLREFMTHFGVSLPATRDPAVFSQMRAESSWLMDQSGISMPDFKGALDATTLQGAVKMVGYTNHYWELNLHANRLNLDRYLSAERPKDQPYIPPIRRTPDPLPLQTLRGFRLFGPVRVDEFVHLKARTTNLSAQMRAMDGDIYFREISGDFYGGALTGEWNVSVKDTLKSVLSLRAAKFQAETFLTDIAGRDYFSGLSDMRVDLTAQGKTDIDMITTLSGRISAFIADGSYSFSDPTKTKASTTDKADPVKRRTGFSSAQTVLDAKDGDFTVQSMGVDSLLLTSTGTGGFSIPNDTIDIQLKNDFVSLPSVAMHLTGRLSDPDLEYSATRTVGDTMENLWDLPQKPFRFLRDLFF